MRYDIPNFVSVDTHVTFLSQAQMSHSRTKHKHKVISYKTCTLFLGHWFNRSFLGRRRRRRRRRLVLFIFKTKPFSIRGRERGRYS